MQQKALPQRLPVYSVSKPDWQILVSCPPNLYPPQVIKSFSFTYMRLNTWLLHPHGDNGVNLCALRRKGNNGSIYAYLSLMRVSVRGEGGSEGGLGEVSREPGSVHATRIGWPRSLRPILLHYSERAIPVRSLPPTKSSHPPKTWPSQLHPSAAALP